MDFAGECEVEILDVKIGAIESRQCAISIFVWLIQIYSGDSG